MQQFQITLKNEKRRLYDRFALLLFLLNAIAVCIFLAKSNYQLLSQRAIPGLAGLAVTLFLMAMLIFNKESRQITYSFPIASFCIVLFWLYMQYWWIGLTMSCLLILYMISKRILRVIIGKEHIIYPAFPRKTIIWSKINNIILKDGLLTIDLKNNRIIQQYIEDFIPRVNEKEFNEFCTQQLKTSTSPI